MGEEELTLQVDPRPAYHLGGRTLQRHLLYLMLSLDLLCIPQRFKSINNCEMASDIPHVAPVKDKETKNE